MTNNPPCGETGHKHLLLDLFCGGGGAARGYLDAGFIVDGVDIVDQPNYPGFFIKADAIEYLKEHGHKYCAIHASPPCQSYSSGVTSRSSKYSPTFSHLHGFSPKMKSA